MSSNGFPPVRNLPHWSRVGCLDKTSCIQRPFPPSVNHLLQSLSGSPRVDRREAPSHSDMDTRVASLQRNIQFLQQQHKDTLQKLHGEIDDLKRENKELQYKLIMDPPTSCRKDCTPTVFLSPGSSRRSTRPVTQGREALTQRGVYLEQPLQDTRTGQDTGLSMGDCPETSGHPRQEHESEQMGGLITSLQPLRIHSSPSHPPRAPTLHECEVIIRQLYNANSMQSQEIVRVKAVLRDIVLNKKITPENYIMTKAYLSDGTRAEEDRLPQLALQPLPKRMSGSQAREAERVILPALKQSLSSGIAERQRRTQAIQRSRLRRTVH